MKTVKEQARRPQERCEEHSKYKNKSAEAPGNYLVQHEYE